jgi:hypothetical protein
MTELGDMQQEAVNQTEATEDTLRRYAGYLQRLNEAVLKFPPERYRGDPHNQFSLSESTVDLAISLLNELYDKEYAPGPSTLRTIEQAPSVHKVAEEYAEGNPPKWGSS